MAAPDTLTHEHAVELLPWLVNESLAVDESAAVREHAASCVICRREIDDLRRIHQAAARSPAPVPTPDMRRINARVDDAAGRRGPWSGWIATARASARHPWRVAFAAQSLLLLTLLVVIALPNEQPTRFTTLTEYSASPAAATLRVVFDPDLDSLALQAILDEHSVHVIDGPTERGVYTLGLRVGVAITSIEHSAALLNDHPGVLFVQPVASQAP